MSGFETIALISSLAATGVGAYGEYRAGQAADQNTEFQSKQLDMKAAEERAASQREAMDKRREGVLLNSRQQAVAAASGGGAGDDAPTMAKIMTDTAGQAEYNAQTALYGGESRARGLTDSARGTRASGKASLLGSQFSAFGQLGSGLSSGVSSYYKNKRNYD